MDHLLLLHHHLLLRLPEERVVALGTAAQDPLLHLRQPLLGLARGGDLRLRLVQLARTVYARSPSCHGGA